MRKNKLTEDFKPKIIELYIDKNYGVTKIADILNIPENPIREFLRTERLLRGIGRTKLYSCNENYFHDITTEHQAYWLGVLFADGNVSKRIETQSGHVTLSSKDTNWIELFKQDVNYTGKIYEETHKVFQKTISKVTINSDTMFNDLVELGCIPKKSLVIRIPAIPDELIRHFIRGYFDGDGTVGVYKNSSKENTYTLRSSFCSGSKEFLEAVMCYLPTNNRSVKEVQNRNLYKINLSVNDSISLYKYLYTDSTICLQRKKDKFESFMRERCSETIIGQSSKED